MLKTKILKVIHHGAAEAKKLLPYIKGCDVFSPEHAALKTLLAIDLEWRWRMALSSDWSRTRFRKETARLQEGQSEEDRAYVATMNDYLFCEKKPVWFLERFDPKTSADLEAKAFQGNQFGNVALQALQRKNVQDFLDFNYESWRLLEEICQTRDPHIAQNLLSAEESIKAFYPKLQSRTDLNLCVTIGGSHRIETYALGVEVINLVEDSAQNRVIKAWHQNSSMENMRTPMLAHGIDQVLRYHKKQVPADLGISSFDNLVELVRTM